jgi:hypothetical protein
MRKIALLSQTVQIHNSSNRKSAVTDLITPCVAMVSGLLLRNMPTIAEQH